MIDLYSDQLSVKLGPFGCALTFALSSSGPSESATEAATIRVSVEHLKVMAFVFHRAVLEYEEAAGGTVPIPAKIFESTKIPRSAWERYWGHRDDDHVQ